MSTTTTDLPKPPIAPPLPSLGWKDAEALVRQGLAVTFTEFTLKQVDRFVNSNFTVTENLNKLFYLIRKPWTNERVSSFAMSYYHPLYITIDGGGTTLRMYKGKVEKAQKPGAMEFRYFGFIIRKSKPMDNTEKSLDIYNGPYTDDNVRTRIAYFKHQRAKRDQ